MTVYTHIWRIDIEDCLYPYLEVGQGELLMSREVIKRTVCTRI
jgi:hypothetical protein